MNFNIGDDVQATIGFLIVDGILVKSVETNAISIMSIDADITIPVTLCESIRLSTKREIKLRTKLRCEHAKHIKTKYLQK